MHIRYKIERKFNSNNLQNNHFFVSGIPVSAGKKKRHVIVANENGAESLLQISTSNDDVEETPNDSIEY
jgi:hypothetical protein